MSKYMYYLSVSIRIKDDSRQLSKIECIKELRQAFSPTMGLKQAKDIIEALIDFDTINYPEKLTLTGELKKVACKFFNAEDYASVIKGLDQQNTDSFISIEIENAWIDRMARKSAIFEWD